MGLTLTTLLIPGENPALPPLRHGETLRTHCPGWTIILPGETEDHGYDALQKLARKCQGPCLFFHYFDDDFYVLRLHVDGKRTAVLSSDASIEKSSKVNLISAAVFGDDRADAALKLVGRLSDLEEQLDILEETLGVSLLEDPEFEPRHVEVGTAAFDAATARLAALKKRKNAYRAVQIRDEDVPDALRDVRPSAAFGRPQVYMAALPAEDSTGRPLEGQVQVDVRQAACSHPSGDYIGCAFFNQRPTMAVRMNASGELLWAFAPEGAYSLLICPAKDADTLLALDTLAREEGRIWLLDAGDGRVLREETLPPGRNGVPRWIDCLGQYALYWRDGKNQGFDLLDETLTLVNRRELPDIKAAFTNPVTVQGSVFWVQDVFTHQVVSFDLASGAVEKIRLEDRAYFTGLGADGLLTGFQSGKELLLFDRTGRLISKHPFKELATLQNIPIIDGKMYVVEEIGGLMRAMTGAPAERRWWRLEKISSRCP
ncbi:MAG: PQQ-like beta-propeller repeat protein [Clostridiales bacterium]|nr:PQQ-like beta-propeller repeat protein [Clostridiales bacterium]